MVSHKIKLKNDMNIKLKNISPKTFLKDHIYDDMKNVQIPKKKIKITASEFEIPNYYEYDKLVKYNFNVLQLKSIARFYKQKVSGNKPQLIFRLYNYLKYSYFIIKIQKITRGHLFRQFLNLHGPAIKNRKCVNEKDFLMYFHTSIRNLGLYISVALAILAVSRAYRGKNRLYNISFILITLMFLCISGYKNYLLINNLSKMSDNIESNDLLINEHIIVPKMVFALIFVVTIFCLFTLEREINK